MNKLLQTACHDWHVDHRGRMVDFAGWNMPVQYSSIVEEHLAVRNAAGMFDVAHMGRIKFTGTDVCSFLDHLLTNDITKLQPGQIRYALVCKADGGILDDVLVYCFDSCYMLVVNASNRVKILDWLEQHRTSFTVQIDDLTMQTFMLAIQGPNALSIAADFIEADVSKIKYYTGLETTIQGVNGIVTRTGYTGEDGLELIVPQEAGLALWSALFAAGEPLGLKAAGLGCRDTLRLEAAMPLYGHELNEQLDPLTAGLRFGVKLKAGDFIGKKVLLEKNNQPKTQQRVGLELEGKRIAREGAELFSNDQHVGEVTSGTFSPTLEKSIAMAYLNKDFTQPGQSVEVDIRGKRISAKVVTLPFYKRA